MDEDLLGTGVAFRGCRISAGNVPSALDPVTKAQIEGRVKWGNRTIPGSNSVASPAGALAACCHPNRASTSILKSMTQSLRTMQLSRHFQQRAENLLPGGVDSPVRAFRAVGGEPPFIVRAEGAYLWDADGNRYLDYFGSWGPMILGHAAPQVVRAVQDAAARGLSFGASTPTEADLAEMVHRAFPTCRDAAICQFGDRSHDVGHPAGASVYRSQIFREI